MKRHGIFGVLLTLGLTVSASSAVGAATASVSQLTVSGPNGTVAVNTAPVITATADGNGEQPYFQFWMEDAGGWRLLQNYSTNGTLRLPPLSPGSYVIVVYALDPAQMAAGAWSQALSKTLILNVGSQVTLSLPSTALAGTPLSVTADAADLVQPVYQWWWQGPDGHWHASGNYQTSPQWTWTPPKSGTYTVVVYAKDLEAPNNATDAVWATETVTVQPLSLAYGYFHLSGTVPGRAWYDLQNHPGAFSVIAPLWYSLGTGTTPAWTETANPTTVQTVTAYADTEKIGVWPTVTVNGSFSPSWWTSKAPTALIDQMVTTAQTNHFGGYVLDGENLGISAATYSKFVSQFASALHAAGLALVVDVLPPPNPQYDLPALAQSANYLDLLAYPEYTIATPSLSAPNPGPTAGYPWVQSAISQTLTQIPASKLLLGISPYGQSWTYTNQGFQGGSVIPDRAIETNLVNQPGQWVYDPVQQEIQITTGPLASAPSAPLSLAPTTFNPAVQNTKSLLNLALLRYAVPYNKAIRPRLSTDAGYGPATAAAVQQFQTDYGVATPTPGTYDIATQEALQAVIDQEGIGNTVSWDENTTAAQSLLGLATSQHLAGVTLWRLGFQAPDFWPVWGTWPAAQP